MGTFNVNYYHNQNSYFSNTPTAGKICVDSWEAVKIALAHVSSIAYEGRIQSWEVDFRETEVSAYPNDFTTGLEDCGESLLEKLIP